MKRIKDTLINMASIVIALVICSAFIIAIMFAIGIGIMLFQTNILLLCVYMLALFFMIVYFRTDEYGRLK
jgi:hypothetical protein